MPAYDAVDGTSTAARGAAAGGNPRCAGEEEEIGKLFSVLFGEFGFHGSFAPCGETKVPESIPWG